MKLEHTQHNSLFRAAALAVVIVGTTAAAQSYSGPPSWMPMTMLMASFDSTTRKLSVMDPSIIPVLTLAPGGTYDPTQPWAVLNGTEYSRRLGWDDLNKHNPDPATHILNQIQTTYGAGANLWIESLSKTPGLECYLAVGMYGTNSPNAYDGIFGTAGSSTKWQWDGLMDHNTYAVDEALTSPGQLFSATYKVYVGDAAGNEILNPDLSSASTLETWTWQAVPEPTAMGLAAVGIVGLLATRRTKT